MGFFDKVKQWLGIGGVKVELQVPPEFQKSNGQVQGKLVVSSKSDQHVTRIEFKLVEHWSTGRGEDRQVKDYELGKTVIEQPFDIKTGEQKVIDFNFPFQMLKSNNDSLKEKGGVIGGLGKVGAFMDAEKSTYDVVAAADVKGTALSSTSVKSVKLT